MVAKTQKATPRKPVTIPVTLIPGDGIGPEVAEATITVLEAVGAPFVYEWHTAGVAGLKKEGDPLPKATLESIRKTRLALKGPLATPRRRGLSLFQRAPARGVRPLRQPAPRAHADPGRAATRRSTWSSSARTSRVCTSARALHSDRRRPPRGGARLGSEHARGRAAHQRFAFDYAVKHNRKKVTLVHKANVLKALTGLFLETGREVAKRYESKGIACDDRIIDACAMQLVMNPWQFDVLVTTNLFGDILSDLNAGLVGGLGMAPAGNIGADAAIFEAVHGRRPTSPARAWPTRSR